MRSSLTSGSAVGRCCFVGHKRMDKLAEGVVVPEDAAAVARMFALSTPLFRFCAEATRDLGAATSPEVASCCSDPYFSICFCNASMFYMLVSVHCSSWYLACNSQCLAC